MMVARDEDEAHVCGGEHWLCRLHCRKRKRLAQQSPNVTQKGAALPTLLFRHFLFLRHELPLPPFLFRATLAMDALLEPVAAAVGASLSQLQVCFVKFEFCTLYGVPTET
jgi:hypothetical protein